MDLAHAPAQGLEEYGHQYKGGQFLPFYVPRLDMPQIDPEHLPELVVRAFEQGYVPAFEVVVPDTLRAHQRVNHQKAKALSDEQAAHPVLVSADGYILDGNHRWWHHVHAKTSVMNTIRIGLKFEAALTWLFAQPFTYVDPRT